MFVENKTVELMISLKLYEYIYGENLLELDKITIEEYAYCRSSTDFSPYYVKLSFIEGFFKKVKDMIFLANKTFGLKISIYLLSNDSEVTYGCFDDYKDKPLIGLSLAHIYNDDICLEEVFLHELVHLLLKKRGDKLSFISKARKNKSLSLDEIEDLICELLSVEEYKKESEDLYKSIATLFDEYRKDNVCWDDFSIKIKNL